MPWHNPETVDRLHQLQSTIEAMAARVRVLEGCVRQLLKAPSDEAVRAQAQRAVGLHATGAKR